MIHVLTPVEWARSKLRESLRHFKADPELLARERVLRLELHTLVKSVRESNAVSSNQKYAPEYVQNAADNAAAVLSVINEPIVLDEREA